MFRFKFSNTLLAISSVIDLNTSYVSVQEAPEVLTHIKQSDLNTSYVSVQGKYHITLVISFFNLNTSYVSVQV